MGLIHDPEARDLSLMLRTKTICDGAKTGRHCKYYCFLVTQVESANPEMLRTGEKNRLCLLSQGYPIEMTDEEKRVACSCYVPKKLPLWKRPLAALKIIQDPFLYNEDFEVYRPLSPEEIAEIQSKRKLPMPSFPKPQEIANMGMSPEAVAIAELQEEAKTIIAAKLEEQERNQNADT